MLQLAVDFATGMFAALRTPFHLHGGQLSSLLDPSRRSPDTSSDPTRAVRFAVAMIGVLSRLRTPLWRNTCLYRSIAECLVLRAKGLDARLVLGVRNADPPHGPIEAHAWVSLDEETATSSNYSPLESPGSRMSQPA